MLCLCQWSSLLTPVHDHSCDSLDAIYCRYSFPLPYALVTDKAAQQIDSARKVTVKQWLNEPGSGVYADEVVDNFASVSTVNVCQAYFHLP